MIGHLLNRELTVWRPTTVTDAGGGQTVTLVSQGTIRAKVNQPSADERRVAQQAGAHLSHVLHTSYGSDVVRGDELDGDLPSDIGPGRRLRVLSGVSDSHATYLRLECEAVQAGG